MKILVVQESNWVERGPHQSHHLMERLSKKGHEIRVIDFEIGWRSNGRKELISKRKVFKDVCDIIDGGYVTVIRPPIIKLPVLDYMSLLYTHNKEIKRQLEEFNPDVIVGFGILNASLAIRLARQKKIPFTYYLIDELHRLVPQKVFQPIARYTESRNLEGADKVVAINEKLKDYAIEMGADPEETYLIRAGVDTDRFNPKNDGGQIREGYGIKKEDIVLFFMGWLYNFSGLKEVALELAKIKDETLKLLIVGGGDLYDELNGIRERYGLQNQIILTGRQSYERIPEFIAASDICLLPAHNNKIMKNIVPIKIYEYLAAGKPVIATELPGVMKEFGVDNGVIYVTDSTDVLAKAIELVGLDDNELVELGKKARRFVEPLDWNKMTNEFEKLLDGELLCV